nr:MAG TPA: major capsid protein [Caudoviricetes sp.]
MATKTQVITNVTNQNQLSAEDKTFYEKTLLTRLLPQLNFYKDAMKKKLPKNSGRTMNFRKFNSLTAPTSSLTEGKTPDGNNLNVTTVTATVAQEGDYILISDLIQMTGIDPIITETSELLGEEAGVVIDTRIQSAISTGTNVYFAGGATTRAGLESATVKNLTAEDIKKIVRKLKNANAKRFSDGFYHMQVDPDIAYDLMSDSAWVDVSKYAKPEQMVKGELGKMHGMKFFETTNLSVVDSSSTADKKISVHIAYAYGKDAYACVELENGAGKPEIIVKPNGSAGSADPLDQRASAGWKNCFTAAITQPLALVRVETGIKA